MQAASQLYMDAIEILADQDEGKEALSGDLFRQAVGESSELCAQTQSAYMAVVHVPSRESHRVHCSSDFPGLSACPAQD